MTFESPGSRHHFVRDRLKAVQHKSLIWTVERNRECEGAAISSYFSRDYSPVGLEVYMSWLNSFGDAEDFAKPNNMWLRIMRTFGKVKQSTKDRTAIVMEAVVIRKVPSLLYSNQSPTANGSVSSWFRVLLRDRAEVVSLRSDQSSRFCWLLCWAHAFSTIDKSVTQ
jgi:hypothetical protein